MQSDKDLRDSLYMLCMTISSMINEAVDFTPIYNKLSHQLQHVRAEGEAELALLANSFKPIAFKDEHQYKDKASDTFKPYHGKVANIRKQFKTAKYFQFITNTLIEQKSVFSSTGDTTQTQEFVSKAQYEELESTVNSLSSKVVSIEEKIKNALSKAGVETQ